MQTPPILFFKTFNTQEAVYQRQLPSTGNTRSVTLSFRSFCPQDISFIHRWVNEPYAARFWQLKGSREDSLSVLFAETMRHPSRHILVGFYNGKPVCEVDIYQICCDELSRYIPGAAVSDCGIHFLMAPPRETFKSLSVLMLLSFIDAYFSYPFAGDLYAEPDELNALANRLALKAGFSFIKKINLPDKMANLYRIKRQEFLSQARLLSEILHHTS